MMIRGTIGILLFTIACSPISRAQDDPHIAENAPKDCPGVMSYDAVREVVELQSPIAMEKWPQIRDRYLSGLPEEESLFVTVMLAAEGGPVEYIFVAVDAIDGEEIQGRVWSDVMMFSDIQHRDPIVLTDDDISDWVISKPDGSEEGNIIGLELERMGNCVADGQQEPLVSPDASSKLGSLLFQKVDSKDRFKPRKLDNYRELKASLAKQFCEGTRYHYYVVDDVLYVLGTSGRDVVISRHFKMPIDNNVADLSSIESSTKGCFILQNDRNAVALMVSHLLSDRPTEFHVLASMRAEKTVYVGTETGLWKVSGPIIELLEEPDPQ